MQILAILLVTAVAAVCRERYTGCTETSQTLFDLNFIKIYSSNLKSDNEVSFINFIEESVLDISY